jgi:teichuronic acid biosynthesis glycosyltransferase TuaC
MKVAVISGYYPNADDPHAGQSSYQTLRILASRCDLHVFSPQPAYPRMLKPSGNFHAARPNEFRPPSDVAATYVPYPILPVISRPFNGFVMSRWLLPLVRRFQPDILLNYFIYPAGYAAVRIGRILDVPVVVTAIGSDLNRMGDRFAAGPTRSTLRRADFVTTVSHDLAKTAIANGADPQRTRAILNGCDTTLFRPQDKAAARESLGLDRNAETIVYVGRLDLLKGLVELIDSVAALQSSRPNVHCYIVGDGPDKPKLEEAIARNGAAPYIKILPPCPTTQVALWMAASDVFALPSYNEGCPNVVVEALAAGRPVVATRVGGIPELMDDRSGRLVPVRDVPALTQAFDEVLSATWDANEIASRHNRSWSEVADDLYEVLESTLRA